MIEVLYRPEHIRRSISNTQKQQHNRNIRYIAIDRCSIRNVGFTLALSIDKSIHSLVKNIFMLICFHSHNARVIHVMCTLISCINMSIIHYVMYHFTRRSYIIFTCLINFSIISDVISLYSKIFYFCHIPLFKYCLLSNMHIHNKAFKYLIILLNSNK